MRASVAPTWWRIELEANDLAVIEMTALFDGFWLKADPAESCGSTTLIQLGWPAFRAVGEIDRRTKQSIANCRRACTDGT